MSIVTVTQIATTHIFSVFIQSFDNKKNGKYGQAHFLMVVRGPLCISYGSCSSFYYEWTKPLY